MYYVEPIAGNEMALGYDLGSNPVRRKALETARDTGKPVATSRITLVQEKEEQFAFLVFLPVYKDGLPSHSVETRRTALLGFVLGVFRVKDMYEASISVLSLQGIDVYIFDASENDPDNRFLTFHSSRTRTAPLLFDVDENSIIQGSYYSSKVSVADRAWEIYCVPAPWFMAKFRTWKVWGIPCAIFLFFLFAVCCIAFLLDQVEKTRLHAKDLALARDVLEEEIVERKKAEKEKLRLEKELRHAHKLESIGILAGGIAHDFNNILTIIIGNTELAKASVPEESRTMEQLKKVVNASERAKSLVQQILSFSRKVDQSFHPVMPHLVVKDTINMLRSTIPTTIEIQENIDPDCGKIIVDPTQIHQILINLCTNGVHAMHEKGTLGISLQQTVLSGKDLAHRSDMEPGAYAKLTVSDTGTGIDPETIERVFDPFFTTKNVGEGTGMGLSMVHGIVMSHHGMIEVESEPGKGSVFHVYFPVVKGEEDVPEEVQEPLAFGTESILLVDDEAGIVELGRGMLEQQGFKVIACTSSIDALEYIKNRPGEIDLVVTDQSMPHMSGTELVAEIQQVRPEMPVILCTGFSSKVSSEVKAREFGITELIMKPFDRHLLINTVRKVLDARGKEPCSADDV